MSMNTFIIILIIISMYMILHNVLFIYYIKIYSFFNKKDDFVNKRHINKITIIVPAYNEEDIIEKKIINIKECIDNIIFPHEVLVGSDGSTDKTCKIVDRYIKNKKLNNWKVFQYENQGKCQTINRLVQQSSGDIIISTDADITFEKDTFQVIIDTFHSDNSIGCISSVPHFQSGKMISQSLYWRYENSIRDTESQAGLLIVSTGGLYAFRKNAFREIASGVMADDLWIPLIVLMHNFKSIHNRELKAELEITDEKTELRRRKRVISGGIDTVKKLFPQLVKKPFIFFIVFSHKINRWLLPVWGILIILSIIYFNIYFTIVLIFCLIIMAILLSPRGLYSLIYSILTPLLSLKKALLSNNLAKWEHIRK